MTRHGFKSGYFYAALLCLAFTMLIPSKAHAMRFCTFDAPKYMVKMAMTKTRYIRTKSSNELTLMSGHRSGRVGGLGGGEIGYKVETGYKIMEERGQFCVGLEKVKVVFFGKPEVHIASNFKRGSCEYHAVLGHEQKHIRTMRAFIKEYAPDFKREVKRISETSRRYIGPVRENQVERAQVDLQEQIVRQLGIYLDGILPKLSARQAQIDTPEEYARVSEMCVDWNERFESER